MSLDKLGTIVAEHGVAGVLSRLIALGVEGDPLAVGVLRVARDLVGAEPEVRLHRLLTALASGVLVAHASLLNVACGLDASTRLAALRNLDEIGWRIARARDVVGRATNVQEGGRG